MFELRLPIIVHSYPNQPIRTNQQKCQTARRSKLGTRVPPSIHTVPIPAHHPQPCIPSPLCHSQSNMDWRNNQPRGYYDNNHSIPASSSEDEADTKPPPPKESMSSWFQRTASSSQAQFAATALVSGAVVAGAIFGFQHVRRQERLEDLKSSIPELGREHEADKVGL